MAEADFYRLADKIRPALYALYKQSSVGDNSTPQPNILALTDRAKWSAWDKLRGKSADEARAEYIVLARKILGE